MFLPPNSTKKSVVRLAVDENLIADRIRMRWPARLMTLYYQVWESKFGSIRKEDFKDDPKRAKEADENLVLAKRSMARRILSSRTQLTEDLRAVTKQHVSSR